MAALLSHCTAPRRKVLGSAWRFTICVSLAISGLMAAAMTWTPVPAASACAATAAVACQTAFAPLETAADAVRVNDTPRVRQTVTHPLSAVHVTKKNVASQSTGSSTGSSNSSGSSGGSSGGGSSATGGLPCQQTYKFVANIGMWTVPPGCYANIYYPNRSIYHASSTFGFCNWWVEALHPNQPDILYGKEYTRTSTAIAGAAVWFNPNVQGAGSEGHWAQAVAVSSDGYWVLITEMNFAWRGGGFGRVDFRYIHVGPGVVFIH